MKAIAQGWFFPEKPSYFCFWRTLSAVRLGVCANYLKGLPFPTKRFATSCQLKTSLAQSEDEFGTAIRTLSSCQMERPMTRMRRFYLMSYFPCISALGL